MCVSVFVFSQKIHYSFFCSTRVSSVIREMKLQEKQITAVCVTDTVGVGKFVSVSILSVYLIVCLLKNGP